VTDARIPVVDAHAHFWQRPGDLGIRLHEVDQPITPAEFVRLMDEAGVRRVLQVTRLFEPDDTASIAGARQFPDRFRVQGRLRPEHRDSPEATSAWLANRWIVGVRIFDNPSGDVRLRDYPDELWAAIAESGVPASIYAPGEIRTIADVAERFPALSVVLDHAGCSVFEWTPRDARLQEWDEMLALSGLANVSVKASAYPEATEETFPFPAAQDLVRSVCGTYGAGRVMWGSNYTPARKVGTYSESVEFARRAVADLPAEQQRAFLADTAETVFADRGAT
jgi:predicted TIM-barrel fold metal-dependent hydrolase